MLALGFSLNTLSLFGLVLAIGIVVDDAIVVVENVERHIELGLTPMDATRKAMEEVSGPIIAIALVLCAVFVPTAFISGLTGQFYRQFALTIAISTVISAFNSLTLSPALASRLLRPHGAPRDRLQRGDRSAVRLVLPAVQPLLHRVPRTATPMGVSRVLRVSMLALVLYVGLIGLTYVGFQRVPQGFVPPQDKDYLVAFAQLPDGATLDRTERVIREMTSLALEHPGVANSIAFPGLSINGFVNASNTGIAFVALKPAAERRRQAGPRRQHHRAGAEPALRRHPGRVRRDLPAAAGAGARHRRRLQALRRGSRRPRLRGALRAGAGGDRQGPQRSEAGRAVLELPGERAADRRARRSRARQDLRRGADRRVRHAAGLPRLALRERLQPLRTHLPGQRPGRVAVPHAARADRTPEDPERRRRDGAAGLAGPGRHAATVPIR